MAKLSTCIWHIPGDPNTAKNKRLLKPIIGITQVSTCDSKSSNNLLVLSLFFPLIYLMFVQFYHFVCNIWHIATRACPSFLIHVHCFLGNAYDSTFNNFHARCVYRPHDRRIFHTEMSKHWNIVKFRYYICICRGKCIQISTNMPSIRKQHQRTASDRWKKWPRWSRKLRAALNRLWKGTLSISILLSGRVQQQY